MARRPLAAISRSLFTAMFVSAAVFSYTAAHAREPASEPAPGWSALERVVVARGDVTIVDRRWFWNGAATIGGFTRQLTKSRRDLRATGHGAAVRADFFAKPPREPSPTLPATTQAQALARFAELGVNAGTASPQVFLELGGLGATPRWVWRLETPARRDTLSRRTAWLDDATFEVTLGPERTKFASVRAFARNPVQDEQTEVFEVVSLGDPGTTLNGDVFDVRNCESPMAGLNCDFAEVAADPDGTFVFSPPDVSRRSDNVQPEDLFAAASVYYHADKFAQFSAEHGFELPCGGEAGVLLANYRVFSDGGVIPISNAAYTGDCSLLAAFGQGAGADWGYDGDVVYHELAHGVIEQAMGGGQPLGASRPRSDGVVVDAGAVGEAIADFLASVLSGDPVHGEYVAQYDGGQGRDLSNTLGCPDGLVGQIHWDSAPFAAALWAAYQDAGDPVVNATVDATALFATDVTFEEAAAAIVDVAGAQSTPAVAQAVRTAFEARGLLACDRWVDIDRMRGDLWVNPAFGADGYDPMRPPPFQVTIPIPDGGDATLRVDFDHVVFPDPGWAPVADIHVLLSFGRPTEFSYTALPNGKRLVDAAPDVHVASINEGFFETDVPPGTVVYAAFFNQGLHRARLSDLTASVVVTPEPDAGSSSSGGDGTTGGGTSAGAATTADTADAVGDDDTGDTEAPAGALDDDGGCSCRQPRSPRRAWLWATLVVLGWRRRPASPRRRAWHRGRTSGRDRAKCRRSPQVFLRPALRFGQRLKRRCAS